MSPSSNSTPLKTAADVGKTFEAMANKAVAETVAATKHAADQATEVRDDIKDAAQDRMAVTSNAVSDYWSTIQAMTKEQTGAATNFMSHIVNVKTLPEFIQLSTKHAEAQLSIFQSHANELIKRSQAMMTGAFKPMAM